MCGICGFYSTDNAIDPSSLELATKCLAHRGPDGLSTWVATSQVAGLGHTRLAVIDLSGGTQPLASVDGRFIIVFNGEIYNYRELRTELAKYHYVFRTDSDTEVLLNAFHKWGSDSLLRLNGMFAFAIFDNLNQTIFLARDRTGIKPLYYYRDSQGIVFGSELKALFKSPTFRLELISKQLVTSSCWGMHSMPATCFRDCFELEPGTFLELSPSGERKGRYWSWHREQEIANEIDASNSLENELTSAVREHLIADVPVGAFLSGGIDSSLIVALAAANNNIKLQTFTVRFGEADYDEADYARLVADHVGSEHREITLEQGGGNLDIVRRVVQQFDQPFGDSSAIPTYLICREIRKHVKVVLGGDGGDEMFGGYERFFYADVVGEIARYPRPLLRFVRELLPRLYVVPTVRRRQLGRLIKAALAGDNRHAIALVSLVQNSELSSVLLPEFVPNDHSMPSPISPETHFSGESMIDYTVKYALPGDYLRKIDVMSSAHGLEVRVPMLSNRILNLSQQLPKKLKYSFSSNKILLRQLASKYLPKAITQKPKHGFGIPLDTWFGTRGRAEVASFLSRPSAQIFDVVRKEYVTSLLDQFAERDWNALNTSRYSIYQRVYSLWSLEHWLQQWKPSF